jgi:hypothetical protein
LANREQSFSAKEVNKTKRQKIQEEKKQERNAVTANIDTNKDNNADFS